jgi:hypothetical protein
VNDCCDANTLDAPRGGAPNDDDGCGNNDGEGGWRAPGPAAICASSSSSLALGGLAKNSVSHFGQRMRAPSCGTASLRTRYFAEHPGQVTIMRQR